jgi:hypothetical protein
MQARNIKVGQQYLARLDSSTERALVTVVFKRRARKTHTSGANGMCSVWCTERTVFDVCDKEGRNKGTLSIGVEARDLFELPARASLCPFNHSFCYIGQPCSTCTDS